MLFLDPADGHFHHPPYEGTQSSGVAQGLALHQKRRGKERQSEDRGRTSSKLDYFGSADLRAPNYSASCTYCTYPRSDNVALAGYAESFFSFGAFFPGTGLGAQ